MFKQPKKADYIEFMRRQGLTWKSRFSLCIEEAEYDEIGDIVNWFAGETYEGRTLRNTPAGVPLQLDIRDNQGDKVDDFCIIIDPASGQILNGWSETDPRVHEILKESGRGAWDTIPKIAPVPSSEQLMDAICDGYIKPTCHEGSYLWTLPSGARLWEIREGGNLIGYGADSEESGYLEQMLGGNPFRSSAILKLLVELEKASALAAKPSPEPAHEVEFEIDFDEEEEIPEWIAMRLAEKDYSLSSLKLLSYRLSKLLEGA